MLNLQISDSTDTPVYMQIANAVCDELSSGQIVPGDKLPTESALAAGLKINRVTASRAYEYLQSRGIIIQKRGSGTFAAPGALNRLQHAMGRRVANLAIILGEDSLGKCQRETQFILTDLLEGLGQILGEREHHWTIHDAITHEALDGLTKDDAVIYHSHKEIDMSTVRTLLQRGVRIVSIWRLPILSGIPHIRYDSHQSAMLACRHLVECGYKQIGFLGRKSDVYAPTSRKFTAFNSALQDFGLELDARYIRDVHRVPPGKAYAATCDMIKNGDLPEALFVDTDYKAMEAICALNEAGLQVPQDIGIVSYDDIPEAATFKPALTTVRTPRREVGQRAAEMLLEWPDDGSIPDNVVLKSELIVRNSTKKQELLTKS
jgi:DNA-binding LacI/PurR family transcriptional regulator